MATHDYLSNTTLIITAYREPETIRLALDKILPQADGVEIMVICPDDETTRAVSAYPGVVIHKDPAEGKPAALNLGLSHNTRTFVIMTDGDVYISDDALPILLKAFSDPSVGAVSGHPVSISPRNTMLGFWSHLLTDAGAHSERLGRDQAGLFFVCSGYLYAVRAELVKQVPADALAEDAVISHMIGEQGYRIRYAPEAKVFVKYPETYRDWLKQKVRSAGGYAQPVIARSPLQMRSFRHEILSGTFRALGYARSLREFMWTVMLFLARLHLWMLIFWRVRIRKLPLDKLWQRVESTK